jgi:hypothetical protein
MNTPAPQQLVRNESGSKKLGVVDNGYELKPIEYHKYSIINIHFRPSRVG